MIYKRDCDKIPHLKILNIFGEDTPIFSGYVKNKSELKQVLKMLNIKIK